MPEITQQYEDLWKAVMDEHRKVFEAQPLLDITNLMQAVKRATRIFIVGAGREGIAARSFAMRLEHLGKPTHWLWDDTTPGMGAGDLFIAVNGSGQIGHIDYLLDQAADTGATIAVITGSPAGRTPGNADVCVFVPAFVYKGTDPRVVPSVQPMGSLFEQHLFLLFDIIILLLVDDMGVSQEEMESRHRNIE